MNIKHFSLFALLTLMACYTPIKPSKPKLVVGIVVDQMRMDYLTRFENHFGNGGFKRFYNQGFVAKTITLIMRRLKLVLVMQVFLQVLPLLFTVLLPMIGLTKLAEKSNIVLEMIRIKVLEH